MFNIPSINIGDRHHRRLKLSTIKNYQIDELNTQGIERFIKNFKKQKGIILELETVIKNLFQLLKKEFWKFLIKNFFQIILK